MPAYPHPRDVPSLKAVLRALRAAEKLPSEGPSFDVCIRDDVHIAAAARLGSYDQVKKFAREMAKLGYVAELLGEVGCDVMFSRGDRVRDIFDDGGPSAPAPLE